jgi:hypothetical protein
MVSLLTREKEKVKVVIPPEIELPQDIALTEYPNAIFIDRAIP